MWPANATICPQLSYGISGNGLIKNSSLSAPGSEPGLVFARLSDHAPHLHLISQSTHQLTPPNAPTTIDAATHAYSSHHKPPPDIPVPTELVVGLAQEAKPLRDHLGHDPTVGKLVASISLGTGTYSDRLLVDGRHVRMKAKSNTVDVKAVVFATASGSLKVVPLLPKKRNFLHSETPEILRKGILSTPASKYAAETAIPWPIKQVLVNADLKLVAVRGNTQCCFIAVQWNNDPGKKGFFLKTAFSIPVARHEWSSMIFNGLRIAFVDIHGNIDVYSIKCHGGNWSHSLITEIEPRIYAPLDWSSWKRICWPLDVNYLLLMSRKAAYHIELEPNGNQKPLVKKLVTTHYWSHIQDVIEFDQYIFLLTSKELIWLLSTPQEPFKRILSWKHYLDDTDSSLRLVLCPFKLKNLFLLSVTSKETPLVITYTFGLSDGKPCSMRDPYVLYTTQAEGVSDLLLLESNCSESEVAPFVDCVEIDAEGAVKFHNFCGSKKWRVRPVANNPNRSQTASNLQLRKVFTTEEMHKIYEIFMPKSKSANFAIRRKTKYSSSNVEASTLETPISNSNECNIDVSVATERGEDEQASANSKLFTPEQIDDVRKYAFELGSDMKQLFDLETVENLLQSDNMYPRFYSLSTLAERISMDVTDLKEFDSMLQQLSKYCEDQGGYLDFGKGSLIPQTEHGNEQITAEKLFELLVGRDHHSRLSAAVLLVLSSIKACSADLHEQYKKLIGRELENCSEDLRGIFGEWQAQEPEIPIDSSQVSWQKAKTAKRGLLHKALTKSSQSLVTKQNSQTSSQKRTSEPELVPKTKANALQDCDTFFLSQFASSQESLDAFTLSSQEASQSEPRSRSQTLSQTHSQSLIREGQSGPRLKKKKKGGFV